MGYFLVIVIAILAIILFIIIESAVERPTIELSHYHVKSDKLKKESKLTFIVIADLHSKDFGDNNRALINAVKGENPDVILIPGDMIIGSKKEDFTVALHLLKELMKIAPVYYSHGNHEQRMQCYGYDETTGEYHTVYDNLQNSKDKFTSKYDHYRMLIDATGVKVLDNESTIIKVNGESIKITGLSIDLRYFEKFNHQLMQKEEVELLLKMGNTDGYDNCAGIQNKDHSYEILLAHNPAHMEAYSKWGPDLIISGHLHGGIIRLPCIGGIITPQMKLLPKYSGGLYNVNEKSAIVSRGLGEHTVNIRVCNPPELSVVHVTNKLQ